MGGWIDLQINGYAGVDFNAPDLTAEAVREVTERLNADGTEGYLPTFVTGDPEMLIKNVRTIIAARRRYAACEKSVLGFFLEGPFISSRPGAVGTHPVEWVRDPDLSLFERFQDAAEGMVKMVNVAAEIPGAVDFTRKIAEQGVVVSLGHQMACTPADITPCIEAGARAFTHLGNGIPSEINRHDNIIATALVEDRASVMFIPDGQHLPETLLKLYFRAVPVDRLIAVSDAQYPAGMPPGEYEVCGARARLEQSGRLWNPERNCLVGSTSSMAKMMVFLQRRLGVSERECRAIGYDNPLAFIQ